MTQKSVEEIRQIAETAISARQKATDAKAAADAAGGSDEDLNTSLAQAETDATDAEAKALALSSAPAALPEGTEEKKRKLLRKRGFIDKDLKALGVDPSEAESELDEGEDLDKPLTRRDLQQIEAGKARQTAVQLADAIADPLDKAAVKDSLRLVVPSGDADKDFRAAVAIANIDRNSKILEEIGRKGATRSTATGTGAPANREEVFEPTPAEQAFMRAPFNLTKAAILKARKG